MRLFGRTVFVALVVCLFLLPSRSQAAPILSGPIGPGTYDFSGTFTVDNEVALFSFSLSQTSTITIDLLTHLCDEPGDTCGFLPILTLFEGSAVTGTGYLDDATFDPTITNLPWLSLDPGSYLLAVTMYENYFGTNDPNQFDYQDLPGFTELLFGPCSTGFAQPVTASEGDVECRSGTFAGSLTVLQEVPEPGTLVLLAVGTAAVLTRRRWRATGKAGGVAHRS